MDSITAKTLFVKQVTPFFKEWGFEYIALYPHFQKKDKIGFQSIILSFSTFENEIWIDVNLAIRKNEVEHIAQQFLSANTDFKDQIPTISISLGKLNHNPSFRYKAENQEDIELCAEQLIDFMQETGMAFLEYQNSLQQLDKLFNKAPKNPVFYVYNQIDRFFKGIILAKITHNPNYEELVKIYFNSLIIQKADENLQTNFKRLVAFLVHYSIN